MIHHYHHIASAAIRQVLQRHGYKFESDTGTEAAVVILTIRLGLAARQAHYVHCIDQDCF